MHLLKTYKSESEQVVALREGCNISFRSLYVKYSGKIYYVAKRFNLSHEEAEGVAQDVFMKVWERRHDLNPELSFNAYVLTIAKNIVIKMLRRAALEHAQKNYFEVALTVNSIATEEVVNFSELSERYNETIARLSDKRKEVYLLSREKGLTVEEIAKLTGLSSRTIENHIFQATQIIRWELGEDEKRRVV